MAEHTPGPWDWYQRPSGEVYLATPNRGHLIVMDFVRLGMQSGQPRFAKWTGIDEGKEREKFGGIMFKAESINVPEHPDARLIAASPDLLAACESLLAAKEYDGGRWVGALFDAQNQIIAAIAKARGV